MKSGLLSKIAEVNKELWLLLSMFAIAGMLNLVIASHQVVLGFYGLPTLFSAYYYGRRHATLTAVGSTLMVLLLTWLNPRMFAGPIFGWQKWADIAIWASILIITGYAMGSLYEQKERNMRELRETYHGVLMILSQFISHDKYTQNHSYRVAVYATQIARCLELNEDQVEDIRAAALLHDIGKLDISRELLYKAARLTEEEHEEMSRHVDKAGTMLSPVGGSLRRVLPLVLAHHDKFDGSGHHPTAGDGIPLGARIIAVADMYDALTSDRPYRKAMSPLDARELIEKRAGSEFDPKVVEAFLVASRVGLMEVPEIVV
ncbi:MAG: HD-GYP domain-containing protein [Terriglobales bacterium]